MDQNRQQTKQNNQQQQPNNHCQQVLSSDEDHDDIGSMQFFDFISSHSSVEQMQQNEQVSNSLCGFQKEEADLNGCSKLDNERNSGQQIPSKKSSCGSNELQNESQETSKQGNEQNSVCKQKHGTKKKKQKFKQGQQQQKRDLKVAEMKFDSRLVFAGFYLLREQFKTQISPKIGYVQLNPYKDHNVVKILYYDQDKKEQIMDKVQQIMENICQIPISKVQAQSGFQLSRKLMDNLNRMNITVYKDLTHDYITQSYYICGNVVNQKILHEKLSEIRKMKFRVINLHEYQNTRSYRAIVKRIYQTKEMGCFVKDKFQAVQIQICRVYMGYQNTFNKGITTVLTLMGDRKMHAAFQIYPQITNFIKQTFSIYCFTYFNFKQNGIQRYVKKIENVILFTINEKNSKFNFSYLFLIIKNDMFQEIRENVVLEIQNMGLDIFGRRFFKNIWPIRPKDLFSNRRYRVRSFPQVHPYSWTISARKGESFDWKEQFLK